MKSKIKWLVMVLGLAMSVCADLVFVDNFENDIVENSDSQTGFWVSSRTGTAAGGSIVESGGGLTLTGLSTTTASTSSQINRAPDAQFDFFNATGLTFSATITAGGNVVAGDEAKVWYRFLLSSVSGTSINGDDTIFLNQKASGAYYVRVRNNGVLLGDLIFDNANTKMISSFSLSVDDTDLHLLLTFEDSSTTYYDVAHGISAGTWGTGATGVTLMSGRDTANVASTSILTVDNLTVTHGMVMVPEPTTMGLFIISSITLLVARKKNRIYK